MFKNTDSEIRPPEKIEPAEAGPEKIKPLTEITIEDTKGMMEEMYTDILSGEDTSSSDLPDEVHDVKEERQAGAYKDLPSIEGTERHHIPADSATDFKYRDGPCIRMDYADHRETASWGNSKEAQEHRKEQRELVNEGKIDEAVQMDVEDVQGKFGDKYDGAIAELEEYIKGLK